MVSIIGIIPELCTCGSSIGRMQKNFEDLSDSNGYFEALHETFEPYIPRICCQCHFRDPKRYIVDVSMDHMYVDNSAGLNQVKPVHIFNPRLPIPSLEGL